MMPYLLSIPIYFASFLLSLAIFLPNRKSSLEDLLKAFLLSTLAIILLSGINYFTFAIPYLPLLLIDLVGLTQIRKLKLLSFTKREKLVLSCIIAYGSIFLVYYSTFATFLAGDIITHASFIRAIISHDPIRIPIVNSYLTDYPKGFHFYAASYAGLVGIINSIKLTSIISLTITLLAIYKVAEKLGVHPEGAVLFAGAFIPHYFYIFWGGYTSQFAMLFILFVILFTLDEDKKYLSISLFSSFIIHPRAFLFIIPFAIVCILTKRKLTFTTVTLSLITIPTLAYLVQHGFQSPFFFPALLQDKPYLLKLIMVFLPALFSIPGYFLNENRILRRWFIAGVLFLFFMDMVRPDRGDPRRLLETYYVLFSLISANVLKTKFKSLIVIFLLLYGSSLMLYEFNKYQKTFTIGNDEIKEFDAASKYINSTYVINLDQICEWFYPLENIKISHPRAVKYIDCNKELYSVTEELLSGKSVNGTYDLCISRYSLLDEKTPFIWFEKVKVPDEVTTYNGTLIKIILLDRSSF